MAVLTESRNCGGTQANSLIEAGNEKNKAVKFLKIKGRMVANLSLVCPYSLCARWLAGAFRSLIWSLVIFAAATGIAQAQPADDARIGALAWLILNQNPEGSWGAAEQPQIVITAQSLGSFRTALINTTSFPYADGISWLANANAVSTDSMARRLIELKTAGFENTALTNQWDNIYGRKNDAFGWGAYAGYYISYPDTAIALTAARLQYVLSGRSIGSAKLGLLRGDLWPACRWWMVIFSPCRRTFCSIRSN